MKMNDSLFNHKSWYYKWCKVLPYSHAWKKAIYINNVISNFNVSSKEKKIIIISKYPFCYYTLSLSTFYRSLSINCSSITSYAQNLYSPCFKYSPLSFSSSYWRPLTDRCWWDSSSPSTSYSWEWKKTKNTATSSFTIHRDASDV